MTKPNDKNPTSVETYAVETDAAHLGRVPEDYFGFVNPPVYRGSTVLFETADNLFHYNQRYLYGRNGSPTLDAFTQAMAALDAAAGAVVTPSGLNAITTALLAFAKTGDHLLVSDSVYRPTRRFCDHMLTQFGIETTYYNPATGPELADLFRDNTKVIFTEAPGSLTMEMQDIPMIADIAHRHGAIAMMDNTWATPVYFKPLDHGVDVVIQAATKFIGGHSDLMLGVITANETHWPALEKTHQNLGLFASPDDVWLALRGLRTLPARLDRHMASGLKIAEWLEQRPEVKEVRHPGLEGCAGHALWKRDFKGAPGLFSVLLHPVPKEKLASFLDALELFAMGYSWGGFESLIVSFDPGSVRTAVPWTHEASCLRLHIGLEDPGDLIEDLKKGFAHLT